MEPNGFLITAEAVSTIVLTIALLAVLVVLVLLLLQARRVASSLGEMARHLEAEAGPVMDRARSVAENVDFIATAVRTDIQKVSDSVSRLNDRLVQASNQMEERVQDFNALVEVLQDEAEGIALDAAAAVRGVRAGSRTLSGDGEAAAPRLREEEGSGSLPATEAEDGPGPEVGGAPGKTNPGA